MRWVLSIAVQSAALCSHVVDSDTSVGLRLFDMQVTTTTCSATACTHMYTCASAVKPPVAHRSLISSCVRLAVWAWRFCSELRALICYSLGKTATGMVQYLFFGPRVLHEHAVAMHA